MANVNSELTIILTDEEKELFEKAIKKAREIADGIAFNTELFVDADSIFAFINEEYTQNKDQLPTVISIYE